MISIPITKNYTMIVDEIDADLALIKFRAAIYPTSGPYATLTVNTPKGRQPRHVHRLIMERILGRELESNECVDHIDGDGLNNQRSNLRVANHSTNAINSKKRSDNQSGYKGVCFHPFSGLWRAYIRVNKKQISLGYFHKPEDAHVAYIAAAQKYYGQFARVK